MAVSPDGTRVYGGGFLLASPPGFVFGYQASDGATLWSHTTSLGLVSDLAASSSSVFAAIYGDGTNSLLALDAATGAVRWVKTKTDFAGYAVANSEKVVWVRLSPDSGVVYIARSVTGPGLGDFAVEAHRADNGELLWMSRYDGGGMDLVNHFGVDPTGARVFVTGFSGTSSGGSGIDYRTLGLRASDGARLWVATYHAGAEDVPRAVAVSPDGTRVAVVGESAGDFATTLLDASTGLQLWSARSLPETFDAAYGATFSRDGTRIFVTGVGAGCNYLTLSYETMTGAQQWFALHHLAGSCGQAWAIGTSPDGRRVYVTGRGSHGADTLAYDTATGLQVWLGKYTRGTTGVGYDLAVGSDGKVYVSGASWAEEFYDMVTLAYDP